jgi:hypothetical protein
MAQSIMIQVILNDGIGLALAPRFRSFIHCTVGGLDDRLRKYNVIRMWYEPAYFQRNR